MEDRAPRKVAELGLGDFAPLDEAIPELRNMGGSVGGALLVVGPDAGVASEGGSLGAASPSQAPTPTDDAAVPSTAADAAAALWHLSQRSARPLPPAAPTPPRRSPGRGPSKRRGWPENCIGCTG
ncbi:uncharacterized protein SOCE26_064480 [Sorangium cellulosum]|uniref:Uncharacterized protein n=1 Tax=Sorangium cellulosum TaxID=56 RepID=A0A2L0F088_SORCE|nr:uncharacterized protein SOCE26_064480 [Sorangium cellulosum]